MHTGNTAQNNCCAAAVSTALMSSVLHLCRRLCVLLLLQAETQKVKDEDRRLQRELTQLQASTHADIERIRMEASESYDRCGGPWHILCS